MLDKLRRGLCLLTALCLLSGSALAAGAGNTASGTAESGASGTGTASDTAETPYDGYIVKVVSPARLQSAAGKSLLRSGFLSRFKQIGGGLYLAGSESEVERLARSGLVEFSEPDYLVTLEATPDDAFVVSGDQWYYKALGVDSCWERGITGQGIRVGVIDSGLNADHEEFAGAAIVPGANYTAQKGSAAWSDTSDDIGHGTLVTGQIAAVTGNGKGIAGLASKVEVVPLKAFQGNTSKLSNIINAIYGGVDDFGCKVLNLSLGSDQNSAALRAAVQYAYQKGVIVITAAGNRTRNTARTGDDPLYYPAAWPEAIGVGAVDKELKQTWFSYQNESVWIAAPGGGICGPSNNGTDSYKKEAIGTSYATPIVTAAAALALSIRPTLTPDDFAALLRDTARDLGEPGYDHAYGYGILDIGLMAASLKGDVAWQSSCRARQATAGERLLLAGYDESGTLVYIRSAANAASLPEAASWRLYVLDGESMSPVREPYVLADTPWTNAQT